ncbi:N-formylglutamate amidohydrolase [Pseudogemmatithrix spongiicola]|uniref:N-formylglutamate amidohydrolase n=1 Tax=Pseudogemmatithrix spongiicola TaxID=3062599 RepID=A0AA49JVH3_9BACT|nr:N-formylglutamate amidohydrolase [Gemmatimonadaceae bacterium 'strain 138']WKW15648.1 N-formylglutamate amidohydrolase [Gemmatimonadaceae bacterium 'strain 318']
MIPFRIHEPAGAPSPIVVDSPHSGLEMPEDFGTIATLDALRTTWDAFVDELWADAPAHGATLVAASFPRAYIDVNRREDDLDPALLATPWPTPLAPTDYSRRGMGLIRRLALPEVPMYAAPLAVEAVEARLVRYYRPYREALRARIAACRATHGIAIYLDAHSMKSRGNAMNVDADAARPDVVVSDRHGTTADPRVTAFVADRFRSQGYSVQLNDPYQGGDLVRSFGAPADGVHAVQVEVNRARYMDEAAFTKSQEFAALRAACGDCVRALATAAREFA